MSEEEVQPIGEVTHYFNKLSVAAIYLYDVLRVGEWVQFYGENTNFVQPVESMEIDRQQIEEGHAEEEIAIKVEDRVRKGDLVYYYVPEEEW